VFLLGLSVWWLLTTKGGFRSGNVFTLYNEKATASNIKSMLGTTLRSKVRSNDRVLVFFAGHGQTDRMPKGGQMGYLVPYEGRHNDLYGTCLSMSTLRETSKMIPSKHVFYIVDACYSGIAGIETRSIPSADASAYLRKLVSLPAVQIMTAGRAKETVIEGPQFGGGHSVFSYNLIYGLSEGTADLNGDGLIPASELYAYIAPRITRDSGGRQTPKIFNMDGDGEFVFFTKPLSSAPIAIRNEPPPAYNTYSFPATTGDEATVYIHRKKQFGGGAANYRVYLDGEPIGVLKGVISGSAKEASTCFKISLPPGSHTFSIENVTVKSLGKIGLQPLELNAKSGEDYYYNISLNTSRVFRRVSEKEAVKWKHECEELE
jgi:hypothetical protein